MMSDLYDAAGLDGATSPFRPALVLSKLAGISAKVIMQLGTST